MCLSAAALAQSAMDTRPPGEKQADGVVFGAWAKRCFKTPDQKRICRTGKEGKLQTGQSFVRTDVIAEESETVNRVEVNVPVGLFLPGGVALVIDDGPEIKLPFITCLANLCRAASALPTGTIDALRAGQSLTLRAVDINLQRVSLAMPLDRFVEALDGPASETFDLGLQPVK